MRTLSMATARAIRERGFVVACKGEYAETLKVPAAVRLYGGFDCAHGWVPTSAKSHVEPAPGAGPALRVQGVLGEVVIEAFEFRATASKPPQPGESVIAASVTESEQVLLREVAFVADDAVSGVSAEALPEPATRAQDGPASNLWRGAPPVECLCAAADRSAGGQGGFGEDEIEPETGGYPGTPSYRASGGERGLPGLPCSEGGAGGDGAAGPPPMSAQTGAMELGAWDSSKLTWIPAGGRPGPTGLVGQGGGGGRGGPAESLPTPGYSGGGGGCGGCGGLGGGAGGGGGASIGLLSVDSGVTFESGSVITGNAGNGGAGAPGQAGQLGGSGGSGVRSACDGGAGGPGSSGGAGGGGAGGISVGVLHLGAAPAVSTHVRIDTGLPGRGGPGGDPTQSTDDGIDGVEPAVMQL